MTRDLLGAILFLVFFTGYGIVAWQIPLLPFEQLETVNSASMPKVYALLGCIFSVLAVVSSVLKAKPSTSSESSGISSGSVSKTVQVMVLMVIYSALLEPLGFVAATILFLLAGFWIMGEKRGRILLASSVPVVIFFWLLMTQLLDIYLAPGNLWS